MAEGLALYDATGRLVSPGAQDAPAAQSVPAPAPAPVASQGPPIHAGTTQQVQGQVEATGSGEIIGGETYVPFGPPIMIQQDPESGQDADPGYPYAWTDQGARRTFRIAESVGLMPLLRFAHAAKTGLDTDDLEGMAALYTMIADCVHADDWPAFQEYAIEIKAEDEELMDFVGAAMEVISARPRKRRGSSSATSPTTSPKSRAGSSNLDSVIPRGARRPEEVDGLMPVGDLVR